MASIDNFVEEETTTTGTGNLTISDVNGARSFNTAFGTGGTDVFYYAIYHPNVATEFEFGTGHLLDASTLVRDTVIDSSNADSLVSFSSGTKKVLCDVPESDIIYDTVSVSEASFTDQQLSTTDSPTFDSLTLNTSGNLNPTLDAGGTSNINLIYRQNGTPRTQLSYADSTDNFNIHVFDDVGTINTRLRIPGNTSLSGDPIVIEASGNLNINGGTILGVSQLGFTDASGDGTNWEMFEKNNRLSYSYGGSFIASWNNFNSRQGSLGFVAEDADESDPTTRNNQAQIYGKDVSNTAEMFAMDGAGNTTQLSSHDEDGYYYVNHTSPQRGIGQEIDVEKAIKFLEEEFGKDFIREYELEAE